MKNNIVYKDNQSTIKMLENGSNLCTGNIINIKVSFFVKYKINKGELKVMYCPTKLMLAEYLTKPLVGAFLREMRSVIMGTQSINNVNPVFLDKIKESAGIIYEKFLYTKIQMRIVLRTVLMVTVMICVSYFEAMSATVYYIFV